VTVPLEQAARSDYAANAGDGAPDPTQLETWPLNFSGPTDVAEANTLWRTNLWPRPPSDWTGISWLGRGVTMAEITDGSSHVFLFGEKYVTSDSYSTGTDWGNNEPLYGGFNNDNHRSTHPHFRPTCCTCRRNVGGSSSGWRYHRVAETALKSSVGDINDA
jgi:hypothetical protein